VCGGYKKDFKWRPFEETTFSNKVGPARQKRSIATDIYLLNSANASQIL